MNPNPCSQTHSDDAARKHALRTPLNHILGFTQLLMEEVQDRTPEQIRADLRKIDGAARQLLGLLEDSPAPSSGHVEAHEERIVSSGRSGSVLVVDDDKNNRTLIVRNLEKHGYLVTEALDGREALNFIRAVELDLVLCDVVMPGIDGVELLQVIRSTYGEDLPVVMISAVDQLQVAVQCIELGAADYIQKPFEPAILMARVRATIERKRLRERELELSNELARRYVL